MHGRSQIHKHVASQVRKNHFVCSGACSWAPPNTNVDFVNTKHKHTGWRSAPLTLAVLTLLISAGAARP